MGYIKEKLNGSAKLIPLWVFVLGLLFAGIKGQGAQDEKNRVFEQHLTDSKNVMVDYNQLKTDIRGDLATIKQELKEINRRLEAIEKKQDRR
jgi:hypothetical protein